MAFKKRNDDARRKLNLLSQAPSTVDFAHYRSVLSNTAVVDEIESYMRGFKPQGYDVGRQLKAIDAFEAQAVKGAEETKERVDGELRSLEKTLKNIEEARPFEDLTVVCLRISVRLTYGYVLTIGVTTSRTRSPPQDQILMSARRSLCRKGSGKCRDTRYAISLLPLKQVPSWNLTNITGKIRRPLPPLNSAIATSSIPFPTFL